MPNPFAKPKTGKQSKTGAAPKTNPFVKSVGTGPGLAGKVFVPNGAGAITARPGKTSPNADNLAKVPRKRKTGK